MVGGAGCEGLAVGKARKRKKLPEAAYGLLDLLHGEGYGEDLTAFLDKRGTDSVVPGICWGCGNIQEVASDEEGGRCEECKLNSIRSALILAGVI